MKIQYHAKALLHHSQVGQQLHLVDRSSLVHGFDLDDNKTIHQHVYPIRITEFDAFVDRRQLDLTKYPRPTQLKFVVQRTLVRRFQQTWAKVTMNLDRRPNDPGRARILRHQSIRDFWQF